MKCKLTRISSSHQRLRTDEVIGVTDQEPTVGEIFQMTGEALEAGAGRWVWTTTVKEIIPVDGGVEFKTRNSHYRFEKIEENATEEEAHEG